ncbi:SPW repeat protein [Glycomyces xiaoerkulensis]|uniref:SPW repeat protein n=1 Tax=Glycomyces xiaoerkulensis TaxID=2038139 RepID=UPI000C267348|nr:SPW repeat protein [Glycomyces xiaoerkulensis]
MADLSHRGDLTSHPDATEMSARYARMMGKRDVVLVDAPVFLAGLFCAISPWVVDAYATGPAEFIPHNLIVGIAIGLLALGFTTAPERMYGLSWAMSAIGLWLVISPWVVGGASPAAGIVWTMVILGAIVFLLGLACAKQAMSRRVKNSAGE